MVAWHSVGRDLPRTVEDLALRCPKIWSNACQPAFLDWKWLPSRDTV
jgi:hypothetical protein